MDFSFKEKTISQEWEMNLQTPLHFSKENAAGLPVDSLYTKLPLRGCFHPYQKAPRVISQRIDI